MCEVCCSQEMSSMDCGCDGDETICSYGGECQWMCECQICGKTCGDCV